MMAEMGRGAKRRVAGASAAELGGHPQGDSKEKRRRRFPWKQLVAVAASVVLVFLMGISLTRSRYQGTQTEDGQIYELRGQKEEIGGGQSATASEDGRHPAGA